MGGVVSGTEHITREYKIRTLLSIQSSCMQVGMLYADSMYDSRIFKGSGDKNVHRSQPEVTISALQSIRMC